MGGRWGYPHPPTVACPLGAEVRTPPVGSPQGPGPVRRESAASAGGSASATISVVNPMEALPDHRETLRRVSEGEPFVKKMRRTKFCSDAKKSIQKCMWINEIKI